MCLSANPMYSRLASRQNSGTLETEERALPTPEPSYTAEQNERLRQIHERLIEARRELDALIGDAYLRPRASIVPVHFLDLASAVEKLRWAEKEWRELDKEMKQSSGQNPSSDGADRGTAEPVPAQAPARG